ncbi:UvrD/REP helicase [Candidatus Omnitrophus magneticus]|uniref:DNA 3'-5' helicase n=1 Tax=Candidatus Omnitrophus magneticus TaxID=1609969 RepID=A0A0F0CWC3_9BACT|nr:UvrD/REP helicase [Candidatus Omnitrophus magneticus]
MKFICDFHIHSRYSRATSSAVTPVNLAIWAAIKGVKVIGTGDFTHPAWLKELKESLIPAEEGLFKLNKEKISPPFENKFSLNPYDVRFLLTAEISNIYKKNGKTRKIHSVILAPSFEIAEKINASLLKRKANLVSDGRPIIGMDTKDLLDVSLNASPEILFVPAHIWTPWFSILGKESGFDSVEECFEDLAGHIYALETGLSADPPMIWMCSSLDKYTLLSNSDAHSLEKIGRNANIFDTVFSYSAIAGAIKIGTRAENPKFLGTIDLFPQEGKYHYAGHRKCGVSWDPVETLRHVGVCDICGNKITMGVMNRVLELADREDIEKIADRKSLHYIIPLAEILSEITGIGQTSKKVTELYNSAIQTIGSEFDILLNKSFDEIKKFGGEMLAEAVRRVRQGEVYIKEGFDGEYGIIKVFGEKESKSLIGNKTLFGGAGDMGKSGECPRHKLINFDLKEYRKLDENKKLAENNSLFEDVKPDNKYSGSSSKNISRENFLSPKNIDLIEKEKFDSLLYRLNDEQKIITGDFLGPSLILAGPGTGKTRVLTFKIARLIKEYGINPSNILALTFTNKAAKEIEERLIYILSEGSLAGYPRLNIHTFHSFGLKIIEENIGRMERAGRAGFSKDFFIINENEKIKILETLGVAKQKTDEFLKYVTRVKNLSVKEDAASEDLKIIFKRYQETLIKINALDFDDLLYEPLNIFSLYPEILEHYRLKYKWLLIDEYQDVNTAQYNFVRQLMPDVSSNISVIGDPNQAIYGFRGADVKFIKKFKEDFPSAKTYHLSISYRCTDNILRAGENIIRSKKNEESITLKALSKGLKINVASYGTYKEEAEYIARTIENMIGGLRFFSMDSGISKGIRADGIKSLSDFAVLVRFKEEMNVIEKAFKDHAIPYEIIGDKALASEKIIKDIAGIIKSARKGNYELFKRALAPEKILNYFSIMNENNISLKDKIIKIADDYFSRAEELKDNMYFAKMLDIAGDYENDIEGFLRFLATGMAVDAYEYGVEKVSIMTMHSAKGLEFECVFIPALEDGLIPYSIFENKKTDIDEEKRLFYVAVTRAKKSLFLSRAGIRYVFGKEYRFDESPFLKKIEKDIIEFTTGKNFLPGGNKETQLEFF